MTVQRLKTAKEGRVGIAKVLYGLALPFLLFFGVAMLWLTLSADPGKRVVEYELLTVATWIAVLVPVFLFFRNVTTRRNLLQHLKSALQDPQYFNPGDSYEMYHEGDGKYLGIDIKNGTILYVHRIRKGQVDVVGLSMSDWTRCEVEGQMFRIYTKRPELPRLEIATPWAQRWYDTLASMQHQRYTTPKPFSAYVGEHIAKMERDNDIYIPKVA
ncbi:plasmid IncI1-type surface exclusion protein ExcA [Pseudomonas syringae pv. syringae]|uniref:plasmid IncI1-type surface exclusion protein ExcA n=1 Tax=Pseudomonas syringae TaxID=317 RepID=UPI00200A0B0B|nr:plasmid IncI1-type surface exclusion protein ExcA [Pseudomonas syringae]MCK9759835.1 plasmid IncI1-type surface exclusion protein ExcA [Pseudomonas syringae pv. syringae]MCK9774826.1 plasmid IncI1-type surface exclusion protein ExcA [Pseudomonas syringae pv. syringae]